MERGDLGLADLGRETLMLGALGLGALVLAPLRLEPLLRGALRQCTFERDAPGRRGALELTSLGRLGSQVEGVRLVLTEGRGTVVLEEPLGRFEMLSAGAVESLGLFHEGKEPVL